MIVIAITSYDDNGNEDFPTYDNDCDNPSSLPPHSFLSQRMDVHLLRWSQSSCFRMMTTPWKKKFWPSQRSSAFTSRLMMVSSIWRVSCSRYKVKYFINPSSTSKGCSSECGGTKLYLPGA